MNKEIKQLRSGNNNLAYPVQCNPSSLSPYLSVQKVINGYVVSGSGGQVIVKDLSALTKIVQEYFEEESV